MNKVKQVIVMRVKYPDGKGGTVGIRRGKEIAQASHASMQFLGEQFREYMEWYGSHISSGYDIKLNLTHEEVQWFQGSYAKVCLQVDTEGELLELCEKAKAAGLKAHIITDSGLTEFHGVPTKTALAIGPDLSSKIDPITGHLKLL